MKLNAVIQLTFKHSISKWYIVSGLFPLLYIIINFIDSSILVLEGADNLTFFDFYTLMIGLQNSILISTILIGFVIAKIFCHEKESKVMAFYKDISRGHIFNKKVMSVLILFVGYHLVYLLSNLVVYYTSIQELDIATPQLFSSDMNATLISILGVIGIQFITVMIGMMFATFSKMGLTMSMMIIFQLVGIFGYRMKGLKYILPNGYERLLAEHQFITVLSIVLGIISLYILTTYIVGRIKYRHLEY